jgi:hypothetical protein
MSDHPVIKHIQDYDDLIRFLDQEIDRKSKEREKGIKTLRKTRKKIVALRKGVPRIVRYSYNRTSRTGSFDKTYAISKEFATFLKVPPSTKLTRIDAARAICVYAKTKKDEARQAVLRWHYLNPKGRDLQVKNTIVPDKVLSDILKYERYRQDVADGKVFKNVRDKDTGLRKRVVVTDDKLYYWVIQKLLSQHLSDGGD